MVAYRHYLDFHGQKEARLTTDQDIYYLQPERTYLIKTISSFFSHAPKSHPRGVPLVYTDALLYRTRIHLRGLRITSPQVGGIRQKDPVRMDWIYPIRKYSPLCAVM